MVSLVRVLDLSPNGRSVLEVTQRWLLLSGTRLPWTIPRFLHVCSTGDLGSFAQSLSGFNSRLKRC